MRERLPFLSGLRLVAGRMGCIVFSTDNMWEMCCKKRFVQFCASSEHEIYSENDF